MPCNASAAGGGRRAAADAVSTPSTGPTPWGRHEAPANDDAALERLRRFGGEKLLSRMIELFLVAAPERIGAARAGVAALDAQAVELALHSLKSSAAQLGALRMQRLSERGESLARHGSLHGVAELVEALDAELANARVWLASPSGSDAS